MNRRSAFLVPLALLLAAPALAQNPGGAKAGAPPATEPELPASDLLVRYESPALGFRWSLAPEAALEPGLVQDMRGEALAERGRQIRSADEAAAATQPGDRKYQTEWSERWEPEAETDLLLAFSTRQYSYTGGAHGNVMFRAVIWDRDAGRRIQFAELFGDANGALAALKPAFCKALDAERKDRRGGVQLGGDYDKCPDFTAYPIVPQGEGEIGAIRVLVPPYEAGPWAEGVYEIALDAGLVRPFLAPRYAGAFAKP